MASSDGGVVPGTIPAFFAGVADRFEAVSRDLQQSGPEGAETAETLTQLAHAIRQYLTGELFRLTTFVRERLSPPSPPEKKP